MQRSGLWFSGAAVLAATHAIPDEIVESAQSRLHVAMNVHTMMLDITRARQSARPIECDRDADQGSDPGNISETDLCDSDNEDMCTASDTEEMHQPACLYK